jgi:hypothetical protein
MMCAGIAAWAADGRLTDGRNPRRSVKIQFAEFVTKSFGGEARKFRRAFNFARAAAMDDPCGPFAIPGNFRLVLHDPRLNPDDALLALVELFIVEMSRAA